MHNNVNLIIQIFSTIYLPVARGTLLDKYGSKHTGSQTNVQAKIRGTYERIRTDGVYIREGTGGVYIHEKEKI